MYRHITFSDVGTKSQDKTNVKGADLSLRDLDRVQNQYVRYLQSTFKRAYTNELYALLTEDHL